MDVGCCRGPHDLEEPSYASDYYYRSRYRKFGISGSRVDAQGNVILRRQLKRHYVLPFFQKLSPCLVGMEACATSHCWSRELQALGHKVRLMPPAYVKPYVDTKKSGHLLGATP
jgi:hypothetical protein